MALKTAAFDAAFNPQLHRGAHITLCHLFWRWAISLPAAALVPILIEHKFAPLFTSSTHSTLSVPEPQLAVQKWHPSVSVLFWLRAVVDDESSGRL